MSKPSIPKGTRDFSPTEMVRRNYIFSTIRKSFQRYGFMPIETPAMENLSTLTGKYGDEGDKLIFKILNSGDAFKELRENYPDEKLSTFNFQLSTICEKALRYDLTVPFARYVVQHQNDIAFPFKRYQIQPVWRADRPQKGRYREFYQCDADVVGSDSLLYEVELIQLFDEVLTNLGIPDFTIKINNRKILSAIAEITSEQDKLIDITVAIDKLDKIGEDEVVKELKEKGVSDKAIDIIKPLFSLKGSNAEVIAKMRTILASSEIGQKGIDELEYIFSKVATLGLQRSKLELDITLARGLNYYTGAIFEVKANSVSIGSICGGGRYDDLTGIFGLKNVSGVGISFGADRIYDVLNELNLFPEFTSETTQVLFTNFGEKEVDYCLPLLKELREKFINAEIYPSDAKLKKQLGYADSKQIKFVVLVGSEELQNNQITLKNMQSGEQITISKTELFKHITL
ncbi:MAG: histidine--tRNA ligase [Bacteroidia bacterium]